MSRKPTLDLTDDLRAIQQATADYRAAVARPEFMAEIEFTIIRGLVRRALAAGYSITVIDDAFGGGEAVVVRSYNSSTIIGALATTGSDLLVLLDGRGRRVGSIALVYNGDEDVIADHSDTLPAGILDAAVRS
jgi:hypothetical protein